MEKVHIYFLPFCWSLCMFSCSLYIMNVGYNEAVLAIYHRTKYSIL